MGKLREIMGKLRVNYGLRFTHKILWGKLKKIPKKGYDLSGYFYITGRYGNYG